MVRAPLAAPSAHTLLSALTRAGVMTFSHKGDEKIWVTGALVSFGHSACRRARRAPLARWFAILFVRVRMVFRRPEEENLRNLRNLRISYLRNLLKSA